MTSEPFDPEKLLQRLDWSESDDLEFKSARGGLPRSLWETYSAMANTHGGVILLGVADDGNISGVKDVTRLKTNLWNVLNDRGKVNLNLLADADVATVEQAGVTILAIHVPRANRYQRPVFIGQNPLTGTYRRNYEGDYHCTEQEVGRMLSDRAEEPADSRILEHYTLSDLDLPSLQQYRHRFASFKPTHPWLGEDDQGFFTKLGGWRKDRTLSIEGLTVAGLLMFGKDEALREALPQYHVDYREKLSDNPDIRWTDRLMPDGTWAGNLFQFYLQVSQRLSADLKVPFQLDADLFRKGDTIVHEAIREALVNALIHADYQGMGGVVVEKYTDRFEFSNPGLLLVSMEQMLNGNVSECRNKTLQTMFTLLGVAEKAGSGVDKIRSGWQSQHWRSPRVTEQLQPDRVKWMLPMVSLIPNDSLSRLKLQFGSALEKFSSLELQALVTAEIEGKVDNSRMRQVTGKHGFDITQMFQALVAQEALIREGHGRWSWYHLVEMGEQAGAADHSLGSADHSLGSADHSLGSADHSLGYDNDSLVNNGQLLQIAQQARNKKRIPQQEMRKILLELCDEHWLSRTQLAQFVQRNPEDLRHRYINPMVSEGVLRLRYPETPNRTDQVYRAVVVSNSNSADE
ncbi:MAG: putative DNA binding domain-containing protein [Ectothiorhodospiraceae bacterium]|nr:putative DNA binding domain-containing protein [Ectothiorhodospiraceae bacterium]